MKRYWAIALVVVALTAITVAVALLVFDDEPSTAPAPERPSLTAAIADPQGTVELTELETLPPAELRKSPIAELQRRTPVAQAAEPLLASSIPATELRDPNDPSGTGDAFALLRTATVARGSANWTAEPHVASKGDRMMVVWNFGAAFSSDGGQTFSLVNPRAAFPADKGPYCCDQLAMYVPEHDLWVWYLQYHPPAGEEENIVRLAYAHGDEAFDARRFSWYDLSADNFPSLGLGEWFLDFPKLGLTDRHLFLALNVFGGEEYRTSVLARIPLERLTAGTALSETRYLLRNFGSGAFAQGVADTMYFAQHFNNAVLHVEEWKDDSVSTSWSRVQHSAYPRAPAFTCPRPGAVIEPGGGDWCMRSDDRLTGGWATGDEIGFAWNVAGVPAAGFPYPFVHVVRIDREEMTTTDEPAIWHPDHAYQYGTFASNGRGDVGGIALSGGGTRYQTCTSLIRDDASGDAWEARAISTSEDDPDESLSGDYLGVTPTRPGANTWVATCMTMHGGGSASDVEVRLFRFGRAKDAEE